MAPDAPLDESTVVELRVRLDEARAATAAQLAGLRRTLDELVEAAAVEPADDEHDPDGTTAYERAQVSSLARIAQDRLAALQRAREAVERPGFGACAACGRPIGLARLLAVPETERCVRCAAAGER